METAIDIFTKKVREGITFVAPFGIAYLYTGICNNLNYLILVDANGKDYIVVNSCIADPKRLAGSMMAMLEGNMIEDWVPADISIGYYIGNNKPKKATKKKEKDTRYSQFDDRKEQWD